MPPNVKRVNASLTINSALFSDSSTKKANWPQVE
jgi:hypothetical protein